MIDNGDILTPDNPEAYDYSGYSSYNLNRAWQYFFSISYLNAYLYEFNAYDRAESEAAKEAILREIKHRATKDNE